jgi:sulfite dehydrogenase (quinone) subunit SoeC
MNPAFSVIVFTTVAGAAQGLAVALALASLAGLPLQQPRFVPAMLGFSLLLLLLGLAASFLHLGRPERAWRAAMMWRTSWLSREVIVLPALIVTLALWWQGLRTGDSGAWVQTLLPLAVLALAALLWWCTAMIYACLRFVQEWAHPLTLLNFVVTGLSAGFLLASAAAAVHGETGLARVAGPAALAATVLAGLLRLAALRRNAALKPLSNLQSATGIAAPQLRQVSMGMSAGAFNTREFFHRASVAGLRRIRFVALGLGFALPALLTAWGLAAGAVWPWVAAVLVQTPGLLADRWLFFAQARHPQNLYYQVVS